MSLLTDGRSRAPSFGHFANRRLGLVSARLPATGTSRGRTMTDPTGIELVDRQQGRRAFMAALAGSIRAAPLAAEAQQTPKVARFAIVVTTPPVSVMTGPTPVHPAVSDLLKALS